MWTSAWPYHYHPKPPPAQTNSALHAHLRLSVDQQLVRPGKIHILAPVRSSLELLRAVFSPHCYSLYTNDCTSKDTSIKLLKFADDTTLIQDDDESANRQEVKELAVWCSLNNLELNTLKTVEMIVDFRRSPLLSRHSIIMNSTVTVVDSFKIPGHHNLPGAEVGQSH